MVDLRQVYSICDALQAASEVDNAKKLLVSEKANTIASKQQSDHLVLLAAYSGWARAFEAGGARAAREFAKKHALSYMTLQMLRDMRGQFAAMLADIRCASWKPPDADVFNLESSLAQESFVAFELHSIGGNCHL